jgi:hypothetical protein
MGKACSTYGRNENASRALVESPKAKGQKGDLSAESRIILKSILKYNVRTWTGFIRNRTAISGGLL